MWTIGDDESEGQQTVPRPDCPGCGEPDLFGDDFCHECGHAFAHFGAEDAEASGHTLGVECPMCASGELVVLEHGRTQCDSCGYMPRDEG